MDTRACAFLGLMKDITVAFKPFLGDPTPVAHNADTGQVELPFTVLHHLPQKLSVVVYKWLSS